jgi:hypothetical protein
MWTHGPIYFGKGAREDKLRHARYVHAVLLAAAARKWWLEVLRCGAIALALMAAEAAFAKSYILVAGRRDPRIYAIDFEAALRPENNSTPNAIVSRSLVGPRRLDGMLLGDPANIVLSADQRTVTSFGNVLASFTRTARGSPP